MSGCLRRCAMGAFLVLSLAVGCSDRSATSSLPASPMPTAEDTPSPTAAPTLAPAPPTPPAAATATPVSPQPRPSRAAEPVVLKPGHASLFKNTILCAYGNRAAASMGILGQAPLEQVAARLRTLAAAYDELNGGRGVTLCFDYIFLVADGTGYPYAHTSPRMDLFDEALQFAQDRGMLFFVDLQLGYRSLEDEIARVLPYLEKPNVHLALDTEFAMQHRGGVPGDTIGSLDATDINRAQALLQRFIVQHRLPDKILKVYQFDPIMLSNKDQLTLDVPNVHLLINGDGVGYGGVAGKLHDYEEYAGEPHNALGIKLFVAWDTPLLQPAEVMALDPQPDEVVYQ